MGDCSRDLLSKMVLKKSGEIIGPTSKKSTRSCGPNFIKFQKVDFLGFFVGKKVENQTKCPVWLPNWTLCQVFDLFSDKKSQKIHFLEFYKNRCFGNFIKFGPPDLVDLLEVGSMISPDFLNAIFESKSRLQSPILS